MIEEELVMFYRLLFVICLTVFVLPLHARERTLLILGDSLSAAYGIPVSDGWVSLLEQRLQQQGYAFNVVNASISGETTIGVLTRLENILDTHKPVLTVVELGGNDGLRGFQFAEIEQNLSVIVNRLKNNNSEVLLVPMQLPPNYGQAYNQKFQQVYVRIADQYDVPLSRFILEDIALDKELMQEDGIHPVARAQPAMLDNIWPSLESLITDELALQ
ncbi:MAG: arylesterase [Gammaproteobacteria bacterium]